jgi:hypothetical protein
MTMRRRMRWFLIAFFGTALPVMAVSVELGWISVYALRGTGKGTLIVQTQSNPAIETDAMSVGLLMRAAHRTR